MTTVSEGPAESSVLHLILAESALELVPEPLWSHPAVSRSARARGKKPGELLLDDTYHHSAMRALAKEGAFEDPERRGRPDIVHFSLLVALGSRLNHAGRLRVWVHTRGDRWIEVAPELRLQRAQHRFVGLMESLLEQGRVPPDENSVPLMQAARGVSLVEGIRRTGARRVVVLDENGEHGDDELEALLLGEGHGDVAVVVGGFPRGALESDLSGCSPARVRLGSRPLDAWSVVGEVVVRFDQVTRRRP